MKTTWEEEARRVAKDVYRELQRLGYEVAIEDGMVYLRDKSDGTCSCMKLRWFCFRSGSIEHAAALLLDGERCMKPLGNSVTASPAEEMFRRERLPPCPW
jgi:hypothetical protein